MPGEHLASSSSQDLAAVATSIRGTLGYIRDTIALYTGFGSQSPPPSPPIDPKTMDDNELVPQLATAASLSASLSSNSETADEFAGERARHATKMQTAYGIKVRDFAYESKLPPVPSYRPPRREESFPRRLKRARRSYEEEAEEEYHLPSFLSLQKATQATPSHNVAICSEARRPAKRPRTLERKATEPVMTSQSQPPSQNPEFGDIREILPVLRAQPRPAFHLLWALDEAFAAGSSAQEQEEPLAADEDFQMWSTDSPAESQEQDADVPMEYEYIDTPIITPAGSEIFGTRLSTCSSLTSLTDSSRSGSGFIPARLSIERSLPDVTHALSRENTPRALNSRGAIQRTSSSPVASRSTSTYANKYASSSSRRPSRPRMPLSQLPAVPPRTPYRLRARPKDRVLLSPTPTPRQTPRGQRKGSPALASPRRKVRKTRSTFSRQVSEKSIKQGLRRSPRTKTKAASAVVPHIAATRPVRSRK